MLKNVPSILTPDLLKIMMEMGHGDEIVIADGNFPGAGIARRMVRCDGNMVPAVLDAVLKFFPLDQYVEKPAALMAVVKGDTYKPTIWDTYRTVVKKHEQKFTDFDFIDRFKFYDRAKEAYAVIATSETSLYANIILKKGVVKE